MKTRIITGIIACALMIPVLIFSNTLALPIGMAICSVVSVYEMMSCIGMKKAYILKIPLLLCAGVLPIFIRLANSIYIVERAVIAGCFFMALYFFTVLTFSHGKYKLADVAICFMTIFYILAGYNALMIVHDYEQGGIFTCLTIFLCAWITDTFAYFCGMLFGRGGKHKLIPDVSPKKTVEGSIGGVVFCVAFMLLYGFIIDQCDVGLRPIYMNLFVGGFLASIVSQIGDLLMSVIKRTYGIKDYGKIFPGHGGMLDRFDSVLAVSIVLSVCGAFMNFFEVV